MEQVVKKNLHPIFAQIYGLNKSWTKKIIVGLEYTDGDAAKFEPIVRICDKNAQGIKIKLEEWILFKSMFQNISKYFNGECDSLQDSEYHGSSWRMKFTFSYRERAISIQEMLNNTHRPCGVMLTPQFEHNIVMKKVTFDTLSEHIVKLVDQHLEELQRIADAASMMVPKVCDHIKLEASMENDAQIQEFNSIQVKKYTETFTDEKADKLQKNLQDEGYTLSSKKIYRLFFEIVSLHTDFVAYLINLKN